MSLYWIPLGAGGTGFVAMNGRIYEAIVARLAGRPPLELYHTAIQVALPEGTFVVETMWPRPDTNNEPRGVVVDGPVFSRWIPSTRLLRYEVRRWKDGTLPDRDRAVGGPQILDGDEARARVLLDLAGDVPALTWGRDESAVGEMWNSNSVISWLLTRSGFAVDAIHPPTGGRAPGWEAGIAVARAVTSGLAGSESGPASRPH